MKKLTIIILCCLSVCLIQCQKGEKGDTGPTGPSGSSTSNAQTFIFYNQPWVNSGMDINLSVSAITQGIIDKGAVMTYIKDSGSSTTWETIPDGYYYVSTGVGFVSIYQNWGGPSGSVDVKVVVIPGS
jgi:hypothetical protein